MNIRDLVDRFRDPPPVVPVVRLDGVIAPRQWRGALSLASHAAALDRAFKTKRAAAVAVVINSPGGSPVQSSLLYRRIRQLADEKKLPVYAFAEDVAASGGYWLALAGDEVYAEETSLLGSIGVVSSGFGFTRLIDRIGIDRRLHTAGENKSLLDPFLPEQERDVERLTALQQDIHATFKEHVRRRRAGKIDAADETLFSGEVMTGRMALAKGLIDGIGDLRTVMRARFGARVRLVPVASERRRRWFLPRPARGVEGGQLGFVADLVDWLEARLLWARFGL
ncbi:MAG TPA: S49 family peptidase [Stellaceae bacterium]|jgi:signal peptide peptidase SppA|nr:S49 family peptidase [Stellaceae bacterium]